MGTTLPTPDYATPIPDSSSTAFGGLAIGTLLIILGVFLFVVFIAAIVTIIFQGIGIMKMHGKLGLKGGWMAFVPLLNSYAMGKVAEQYIKENGKKSAKFSVILLVGNIINMFFAMCSGFFSGFATSSSALYALGLSKEIIGVFTIINLILSLCQVVYSLAYSIVVYVVLWRIYAIFNNQSATLFLILSLFIGFVQPFLIFAIRNNEPCCVEVKEEIPIEVIP